MALSSGCTRPVNGVGSGQVRWVSPTLVPQQLVQRSTLLLSGLVSGIAQGRKYGGLYIIRQAEYLSSSTGSGLYDLTLYLPLISPPNSGVP